MTKKIPGLPEESETLEKHPTQVLGQTAKKSLESHSNKTMSRAFWISIVAMTLVFVALTIIGSLRSPVTGNTSGGVSSLQSPAPLEVPKTILERILSEAAKQAHVIVAPSIDDKLADVYAPVYAAIPIYADFHYSIFGEYTELTQAALGRMDKALYEELFDGFEDRLERAADLLDQEYTNIYINAVQDGIRKEFPSVNNGTLLGPFTQAVILDATRRAKITTPLATVAAATAGRGALKASTSVISRKIAARVAAKVAAKGVAKGGGILVGAGSGALLCSWSGPGAVLCGVVGGVGAWLVTDKVVISLDEYFHRDEFEAELRQIIDEDRAKKRSLLKDALKEKSSKMDAVAKNFTLRELSE